MATVITTVDHQQLRTLLPHSGTMCLLDRVSDWDEQRIACTAVSHRDVDNPLREGGRLPIEAGIEYAAQAMAIHGTLCARARAANSAPRIGYLAVLSRVEWQCQRLDEVVGELVVRAEKLMVSDGGSSYRFSLDSGGETLLSGEALVALE